MCDVPNRRHPPLMDPSSGKAWHRKLKLRPHSSLTRGRNSRGRAHQMSGSRCGFCSVRHPPPSLLGASLTFSTAVLALLVVVVVVGVQDGPIGVRVGGPGLPVAFVLWGTEGFGRVPHQPRSQQLRRCLSQLVFGCETVKGTETQGWRDARSNPGGRPALRSAGCVSTFGLAKAKAQRPLSLPRASSVPGAQSARLICNGKATD